MGESQSGESGTGFSRTPVGARERLPGRHRLRRAVTHRLLRTFEHWGYEQVTTPLLEYFDVVARGLSPGDRERCVRFLEPGTGEIVALRADMTPQIARMIAGREASDFPLDLAIRLGYAADVVRRGDSQRVPTEQHQAGVELVGDGSPAADAEVVALCAVCLRELGIGSHGIDLAHVEVARAVLDATATVGTDGRRRLEEALARKDRAQVAAIVAELDVPAVAARAALQLVDLVGPFRTILDDAAAVRALPRAAEALDRLARVLGALEVHGHDVLDRVVLDLGEVRGFDYYTGLRLRVWAAGVSDPLVRGGRYDGLLGQYGVARPAVGFAFDLDALELALGDGDRPASLELERGGCLIALGDTSAALRERGAAEAEAARTAGARAFVQAGLAAERALQVASAAGVERVIHLAAVDAAPRIWQRRGAGWTAIDAQGAAP